MMNDQKELYTLYTTLAQTTIQCEKMIEETRVLMREIYPLIIKKEDIDFLGKELPDE